MTDAATPPETSHRSTWKAKKKRGAGTGKPAPAVVISGANFDEHFPPPKPKLGAPTIFSEEMADRICDWVATGRTLTSFCKLDGTPSASTVFRWLDANPSFWERYARARIEQTHSLVDRLMDETDPNREIPPEKVAMLREWGSNTKFFVSKVAPKLWGDKLDIKQEISGPGGGPLQAHVLLDVLLTAANLERLEDHEISAIRSAAAKLALPAPVIDAVATAAVSASPGAGEDGVGAFEEAEPSEDVGEG
jgi:hypothetical protein